MLKERESNLEALRIVSMMMVVLVHIDGASLGLPSIKGDLQALTSRDVAFGSGIHYDHRSELLHTDFRIFRNKAST